MVVGGAGFLMNNEMDDFSAKTGVPNKFGVIGNDNNAIAPGKRMLSSMTPRSSCATVKPRWSSVHLAAAPFSPQCFRSS